MTYEHHKNDNHQKKHEREMRDREERDCASTLQAERGARGAETYHSAGTHHSSGADMRMGTKMHGAQGTSAMHTAAYQNMRGPLNKGQQPTLRSDSITKGKDSGWKNMENAGKKSRGRG